MITLSLPAEEVSFTINGSSFLKELRLVTSIFRSGSNILIAVSDEKLAIVANDSTKSLCFFIENATGLSGNGCFILDPELFSGIISNRSEITFTLNNSSLKFKAVKGRYDGELAIEPANPNLVEQLNEVFSSEVKELSIPDSAFSILEKGIKFCNLNDSYAESDNELVRYLIGKKDSIKVVTYDQFHSAIFETSLEKSLKKEFSIAVYQSYFSAINSLAKGNKFNIAITENLFYAKNDNFFLSLPPIQYNEEEFNSSLEIITSIMNEKKACSCVMEMTVFEKVINNLCSIYESGSKIEVNVAKEKMKLSLATNYGSMGDAFPVSKVKGEGLINVDAPPIKDVIKCAPSGSCNFSFIEDKAYLLEYDLENTKLSYMIAVLQQ